MRFDAFFRAATGRRPYPFQRALAEEPWPELLTVPTGLGKTEAVILAWLYRRHIAGDATLPRRLVWCLPRRALAEALHVRIGHWLEALAGRQLPVGSVALARLAGRKSRSALERRLADARRELVIVATADVLPGRCGRAGRGHQRLSQAAGLDADALWVHDEAPLMGAAALKRVDGGAPQAGQRLLLSATPYADWFVKGDSEDLLRRPAAVTLGDADRRDRDIERRLSAAKHIEASRQQLDAESAMQHAGAYVQALTQEVAEAHQPGQRTLVIVNSVDRATALFHAIGQRLPQPERLLVHERLRAGERSAIERGLRRRPGPQGRVIIATQALEAAVDVSSHTLFTELAPWPALVQRFGRCNRAGEHGLGEIRWIDIEGGDREAAPYRADDLAAARGRLLTLHDASPAALSGVAQLRGPRDDASRIAQPGRIAMQALALKR